MQPNAPPAPPPAPLPNGEQNPYAFIMDSGQQPKKGLGGMLNGNSQKQRIIIVGIAATILIVIAAVLFSIISSSGKGGTQTLVDLAQQQAEIIRVSDIGVSKARGSDAKNLAITTKLSVQTTQVETLALLQKKGHKLGTKDLALKKSTATDEELTAADTANTFDETFTKLLQNHLKVYRAALQNAYKNSSSDSEKQVLQTSFKGVGLLVGNPTTETN